MNFVFTLFFSLFFVQAALIQPVARASPENDRVYQLDGIAWLRASDNADGIFSDYLEDQYATYFSGQSRFTVVPLKGLREILDHSSARYPELIQQADILKRISQKYRVENLIRTRVYKENDTYRFVIEWVYAPRGDVLSSVEFRYLDAGTEAGIQKSELPRALNHALDELIQKLPFLGEITGVDGDTITVSVGHNQNVKPKDTVTLYTLQSVKRHPLLKTIEEWRWQPVGRAEVEQVEESLSFAKVTDLEPEQKVIRYQKVREIIPAPPEPEEHIRTPEKIDIPRLGWVSANIGLGSYSRQVGLAGGTSGRGGGGLMEAFEIDSQVWLNSRFIAQGTLGGMVLKYSPTDLSSGSSIGTSYNGSGSNFRIAGGYSLFPMKTVHDSIAWVDLGYKTTHYSLSTDTSNDVGTSDFGCLFIGIGGQMYVYDRFGAELGLDLGIFHSASESDLGFGGASGSTDLSFRIAGTYHFQDPFYLRLLIKLNSQSMDFSGGQSLSEKTFMILPSIMYYF